MYYDQAEFNAPQTVSCGGVMDGVINRLFWIAFKIRACPLKGKIVLLNDASREH